MSDGKTITVFVVTLAISVAAAMALGYYLHASRPDVKRDIANSEFANKNFLRKQGWTSMYGDGNGLTYELQSVDAGKNWFAIGDDGKVLGDAEEVYPGLLGHLSGMDNLTAYVKENGPIGSNSITDADIHALEEAGFTVTQKS